MSEKTQKTSSEIRPRRIAESTLKEMLDGHRQWATTDGKKGRRAILAGYNLQDMCLEHVMLDRADLSNADLTNANLEEAHLNGAELQGAILTRANLTHAHLKCAILDYTSLQDAQLINADLSGASLVSANLPGCQLQGTNFRGVQLRQSDFRNALGISVYQFGGSDITSCLLPESIQQFGGLTIVEERSKAGRRLLLSMLLACVYIWLTIGTTTDKDIVTNSATSPLPIIGSKIPLAGFYPAAATILLAFYIYFHLYLQRLWEALTQLPARFVDGRTLTESVYPWIFSGLVDRYVEFLRQARPVLSRLQWTISLIIGWWVVPATLILIWIRNIVRHDWLSTGLLIVLCSLSIWFGVIFFLLFKGTLRGKTGHPIILGAVPTVLFACVLTYTSYQWIDGPRPWSADLMGAEVSKKPAGWTGQEVDLVRGANLFMADLRDARFHNAFVVGAYMRGADLRGASFFNADLRGADLIDADLRGAFLSEADLRGANLTGANLTGAYLGETDLRYTRIGGSRGQTHNWNGIQTLEGANIFGVKGFGRFNDERNKFLAWAVNEMNAFCVESDSTWKQWLEQYVQVSYEEHKAHKGRLQPGLDSLICIPDESTKK